ncbi:hypothetical protein [Phenylobacterium soli]|uniref:Uncharacterized protein n=1 Tax=Phenylobacterium soli TaxID=2170551 RepID=A0A328AKZ9_9CAUL|nr:hypothetical protein [Phenylobacterium soli]RAK54706.1 hypothetical protein DJ017_09305 [Phenylobacterium soli]
MRTRRRSWSSEELRRLDAELGEAARGARVSGRVCDPGCAVRCAICGSTMCECACTPECPQASAALSVDPELYPIEPAMTPLVFEMKRLGVFETCWSCEGHDAPDGRLWKTPSLWFYARSQAHLRLLAGGLSALAIEGRLSRPWRVFVTHSEYDNPDTMYALEPVLEGEAPPSLAALQGDLRQIAAALPRMIREEAARIRPASA